MKYLLGTIGVLVLVAAVTGFICYRLSCDPVLHAVVKQGDTMEWLRADFHLDDAQFAAIVDSDFADGLTQGRGYVLQGAWAPIKNMTMKATYFINDRNYDTTSEVDYKRLQLDLNYKF